MSMLRVRSLRRSFATSPPASKPKSSSLRLLIPATLLATSAAYITVGIVANKDDKLKKFWLDNVPGGQPALDQISELEKRWNETSLEDVKKKALEVKETAEAAVTDAKTGIEKGVTKIQTLTAEAQEGVKTGTEKALDLYTQTKSQVEDVYSKTKSQVEGAAETAKNTYKQVSDTVHTTSTKVFETVEWVKTSILGETPASAKSSPPPPPPPQPASTLPPPPAVVEKKVPKAVAEKKAPPPVVVVEEKPAPEIVASSPPAPLEIAMVIDEPVKEVAPPVVPVKAPEPVKKAVKVPAAPATPAVPAAPAKQPEEKKKMVKPSDVEKVVEALTAISENIPDAILKKEVQSAIASLNTEAIEPTYVFSSLVNLFEKAASVVGEKTVEELAKLQSEVEKLTTDLQDSSLVFLQDLATKEKELRDAFDKEYSNLQEALSDEFASVLSRMANEFEQVKKNEIEEVVASLERDWEAQIRSAIDNERDGRLARLDHVAAQLKYLQNVAIGAGDEVGESRRVLKMQSALALLNARLEGAHRAPLFREVEILKTSISEQGVATFGELAEGFKVISSTIRQVQLMPEFGGPISYSVSSVLSPFVLRKQGLVPGDDVESVLARTEYYLEKGDVESGGRELNQLKGWPKKIAKDWLEQVRLHLEVKQATEIIDCHLKLAALGSV
ncbi:mitochondrial inner membrane protein Mitofilin [Chytridium lagenaria]|nr:mitochondrial inner membrane protein Mitofilin [Chytridium lagenaria]